MPSEPDSSSTVLVRPEDARAFASALLQANHVTPENATLIADCLVQADLRGVDSHGINRLPSYLARVRAGVLDPTAEPTLTQVTPVVAHIDAHNAFGFPAAAVGMRAAMAAAQTFGIGLASVAHSNHFGMSAWLVRQAVDAGLLALVFTNSSPALPPFGSATKLLGVSPLACGAPAGTTPPFILDMAPSVAARGKVYKALRRGEAIPEGWALDAQGNPTTDPAAALEGVMLPMGGPKGSALAIMMDVFSGVLSGSAFAGGVVGPYDTRGAADVGHFLVAIKPDLFMGLEEFKSRMDVLYRTVVGCKPVPGADRVYFPGELEQIREEERARSGIPYVRAEIEKLDEEARRVGAPGIVIIGDAVPQES